MFAYNTSTGKRMPLIGLDEGWAIIERGMHKVTDSLDGAGDRITSEENMRCYTLSISD